MTTSRQPRPLAVLAAPDKFRGTATAPEVAAAIDDGVRSATGDSDADGAPAAGGHADGAAVAAASCRRLPLADGGEGTVDAFGGANRFTEVTGPDARPVRAGWRLDGTRAVIEMAAASGLALAGGPERNDPWAATSRGTGELILAAARAGAREILIGLGGSATTDGGAGALEVLAPDNGPSVLPTGVSLRVCADVRTRFLDAATVFGPQKGADPSAVAALTERLRGLAADYRDRFGVDVAGLDRAGAAGGLAGGLAAIGAGLVDGFAAVADAVGLDDSLDGTDLVVTGEGSLDATSLRGKVVGGVIERAALRGIAVVVVAGRADEDVPLPAQVTVVSLTQRFGQHAALTDTCWCIRQAVAQHIAGTQHVAGAQRTTRVWP